MALMVGVGWGGPLHPPDGQSAAAATALTE